MHKTMHHKLIHHRTRVMLKDLLDIHKLFRMTKSPDTNIDENRYMGFPTSKYDSCSIHYSLAIFIYNFVLTAMPLYSEQMFLVVV